MAKREVDWQPDIYDMAARQVDDSSPTTPRPSGRISNLTARWRRRPPPAAVRSTYLDGEDTDTSLLLDMADDPLLDDEDGGGFDAADDSDYATPPAKGKRANAPLQHRPVTMTAARVTPPDDNSGLLGLVLGALVGAGLTLLVTPAAGKQLRARLQAAAQQQADQGNTGAEIVAHNMPNIAVSEQAAPVAGAARP